MTKFATPYCHRASTELLFIISIEVEAFVMKADMLLFFLRNSLNLDHKFLKEKQRKIVTLNVIHSFNSITLGFKSET